MKIKATTIVFICIVSVFSAEDPHLDSCLANIPKYIGLNSALGDSQSVVLRKIQFTKTKNALGHTYWFAQTSFHNVPIYLQCFFENSLLIHVFISRKYDIPCDDPAKVSNMISLTNNSINSCLHTSLDDSGQNGSEISFDTATSTYRLQYSYLLSNPKQKKCGFTIDIVNKSTDHYKIREEEVDKLLRNIKEENKRF